MIYLFEFMNTAFPKAGLLIGATPITIAEIFFVITIVFYMKYVLIDMYREKNIFIVYSLFVFGMIISTITNFDSISIGNLAIVAVLILSPLTISIGSRANYNKSMKIISLALIIVGMYALLQWLIGIEETAIYGLNIAYGDSFANKPIGLGYYGLEAVKMPSTYQNGNGAGLFYTLFIPFVINWKSEEAMWNKIKNISLLLGIIGLLLSGSRSILIPFIVISPILIFNYVKKLKDKHKILILLMLFIILFVSIIYMIFSNSEFGEYFINRYIIETLTDSTANGRITQIKVLFNSFFSLSIPKFIKTILVGFNWKKSVFCEGVLYIFSNYGLINFSLFIILLTTPIINILKKDKIISIGLVCVFIAFLVDTSFNYPPALMNYFLAVGIYNNQKKFKYLNNR